MAKNEISLSKAGKSWVAYYYDRTGKRRGRSLGLIKGYPANADRGITRRQARVLRDRLAVDLQLHPARNDQAPKLSEYLKRYLKNRLDLQPGTITLHDMTCRYLKVFFGEELRIDRISRVGARDWHTALSRSELDEAVRNQQFKGRKMAIATVCKHVRNAKVIFGRAMRDDLIPFNPFDRLTGKAPQNDANWRHVTPDELTKLFDACPNIGWRVFLALCRVAGLRRGEALNASWDDVDWNHQRLAVIAKKTGKKRVVPIEPNLHNLLIEMWESAEPGETFIVPRDMVSRSSVRTRFQSIIKAAGLEQWAGLYQVLRRNRETDWAQTYPQYVVSKWMGHNMKVSEEHYLQVPEELYEKAAAREVPSDNDDHAATDQTTDKLQNNCKTNDLVGMGADAQVIDTTQYPRQGSNLQPSASEADTLSN